MYMPTFDVFLSELNITRQEIIADASVTIPTKLFRFLLQVALLDSEFNEDGYLAANPDIPEAFEASAIDDPRQHDVWTGYFEDRIGTTPAVDEEWYLNAYPDVATAVQAGTVASAAEHFATVGAKELRAPGAKFEEDAGHWGTMLRGENCSALPDQIVEDESGSLSVWSPGPQA